jgi:hypothetical protein
MKIRPVGAKMFHVESWTSQDDTNSGFSQFYESA